MIDDVTANSAGFAERMCASFPPGVSVPEPLARFFEWQERSGLVRAFRSGGEYAGTDTAQDFGTCYSQPVDPGYADTWLTDAPQAVRDRLAPFFRTGGDGSISALWRDDAGNQHIVHLGSGSGSTMLAILASDPIDFLRLLAIGYDELCWPEQFDQRPAEIDAENDYLDMPVWDRAAALRSWVEATFAVEVPTLASAIVARPANMDDDDSDDPFLRWIRQWQDST